MLLEKFKSIFGDSSETETIKREMVIDGLENINKLLHTHISDDFGMVIQYLEDLESTSKVDAIFKSDAAVFGLRNSNSSLKGLIELRDFCKEVETGAKHLYDIAHRELPEYMPVNTLTAKQAGIVGTVTALLTIVFFIDDYLLYLIYRLNNSDLYYRIKEKEVKKGMVTFGKLYKELNGKVSKRVNELSNLSDTELGDSTAMFRTLASKADRTHTLPIDGFIGSPIYFFRKWWVDIQISRYEYKVDKKNLLELKLYELKLKDRDGKLDVKKQEAVEYYEKKIARLEADIKDFEEE